MAKKTKAGKAKTTKGKKVKSLVVPAMCAYHDSKAYAIEVQLPGVEKKDIQFEMTEASFCLKAPKGELLYFGCWTMAHNINPRKAKATYKEGLLTVTVPLAKRYKGVKVTID